MSKNLIPDFSNCVKDRNGDIWCYSKNEASIYRITKPENIPQDMLYELWKGEYAKKENK
jgi:hypothetical protein